jgi:hypothetical protein
MVDLNISIQDNAAPALQAKIKQCDPHLIATRISVPLARHWRDHLKSRPRNKNDYPSTGFWESAARSVVGVAVGGDAVISADKLGLKQRLYGGTITARNVQNLTIPICAEAYGTSVADWGFDNLVLVILADGRKFLALWLYEAAQTAYAKQLTKLTKHAGTTATRVNRLRAALAKLTKHAGTTATRVKPDVIIFRGTGSGTAKHLANASRHMNLKFLFVLKHSVDQAANPLVIPPDIQEFAVQQVVEATR